MEILRAWKNYSNQNIFAFDYIFQGTSVSYYDEGIVRSFKREGTELHLTTEVLVDKGGVAVFEELTDSFLASFDAETQMYNFNEDLLEEVVNTFDRIVNRNELVEFMRKSVQTNIAIYKMLFCDVEFATYVTRAARANKNVGAVIIANVMKNGLLAIEKVISGCGTDFFTQNICREDFELANDKKKLKQVLGLPAVVLEFLKSTSNASLYAKFKEVAEARDVNDCSLLVEYINLMCEIDSYIDAKKSTHLRSFVETILDIALLTPTRMQVILNYLHNQEASFSDGVGFAIPNSEAIEMRDYLSIAKENGITVDPLPSNLRAAHFYLASNTEYSDNKEKEAEFLKAVGNYTHLEEVDKEYVVVAPKSIKDMVLEGQNQHHCIASYVDMVSAGKSIVLFLRKKDTPDESYISFEMTDDGEFVQIKGKYDFDIEPDGGDNSKALDYLIAWRNRKWAKEEEEVSDA